MAGRKRRIAAGIALAVTGIAAVVLLAGWPAGGNRAVPIHLLLGLMWMGPPVVLFIAAGSASHHCEAKIWLAAALIDTAPAASIEAMSLIDAATNFSGVCSEPPDIYFTCSFSDHLYHSVAPEAGWNAFGMLLLGPPLFIWGIAVGASAYWLARDRRMSCSIHGCRYLLSNE